MKTILFSLFLFHSLLLFGQYQKAISRYDIKKVFHNDVDVTNKFVNKNSHLILDYSVGKDSSRLYFSNIPSINGNQNFGYIDRLITLPDREKYPEILNRVLVFRWHYYRPFNVISQMAECQLTEIMHDSITSFTLKMTFPDKTIITYQGIKDKCLIGTYQTTYINMSPLTPDTIRTTNLKIFRKQTKEKRNILLKGVFVFNVNPFGDMYHFYRNKVAVYENISKHSPNELKTGQLYMLDEEGEYFNISVMSKNDQKAVKLEYRHGTYLFE